MHPELEAALHRLRADRLSGATALTIGVCSSLGPFCERMKGQASKTDLEEFALSMVKAQPNMGSLWNLANGVLHRSADPLSVASFCASFAEHCSGAAARVAEHVAPEVSGRRVLTSSSSSAVFHTLLKASSRAGTSVIVCESRPMREGVLMARELGRMGVGVTVIADAAAALLLSESSVAIAGADAVNKEGVIGKIGLAHIALACEARGTPLLILADSAKFAPVPLSKDPRDPSELLEPGIPGVSADNRYFEHVGFDHVPSLYSETGRLSTEDAQRAVWGSKVHSKLAQRS